MPREPKVAMTLQQTSVFQNVNAKRGVAYAMNINENVTCEGFEVTMQ